MPNRERRGVRDDCYIVDTGVRVSILSGHSGLWAIGIRQGDAGDDCRANSAAGKEIFEEIADPSGIGAFQHTDGSSGRKFFVEQMGGGVAIFDYDGDGWPDVYLCSGAALPGYKGPKPSNRLFRNKHDGTFEDVTEKAGVGCRQVLHRRGCGGF